MKANSNSGMDDLGKKGDPTDWKEGEVWQYDFSPSKRSVKAVVGPPQIQRALLLDGIEGLDV